MNQLPEELEPQKKKQNIFNTVPRQKRLFTIVQVVWVKVLSRVGTVFAPVVMGGWRQGFHTT